MRCLLCFFLQNGCSGRGCLNNICIASYGVGAKFFTMNLMSVDLPQNTPKTRKPIAERTSHKWHGYTTRGCSSLCCTKQLLLLPRNARNAQNLLQRKDSHGWHRLTQMVGVRCSPTEFTEYTEFGSVGMAGMPYPPNLCASVGGSSLPEDSVCSVRSVGEHRSLVGALETSAPPTE